MEIPLFFEGGISVLIQFLLVTHWQQKLNGWRGYGVLGMGDSFRKSLAFFPS